MVNAIACTIELWYTREVTKHARVARGDSRVTLFLKQTSQVYHKIVHAMAFTICFKHNIEKQRKSFRVHTTLLASLCHAMPFLARALKKNINVWSKINRNVVYRCPYSYRQRVCAMFPKHFLRIVSAIKRISELQAANLHNAARALSSSSRCFQLSRQIFISLSLVLW